jgi:hypothetical protein
MPAVANVTAAFNATGLARGSFYDIYMVATDAAGNKDAAKVTNIT